MTIELLSKSKKHQKKTKTIYKKTLTNVYKYVLSRKRTEIKVAARDLKLNKESVRQALTILTKHNFVKERKYKDIGVSYFYPCEKRTFMIYVFHPVRCFLIVFDSKMNLWYRFHIKYFDNMMPEDNLHHFLKKVSREAELDFGGLPDEYPYVAFPGMLNEKTGRIKSDTIPELALLDVDPYICELLKVKHARKIFYDYSPEKNFYNYDFYLELAMSAFDATFIRKKNKSNNTKNKN